MDTLFACPIRPPRVYPGTQHVATRVGIYDSQQFPYADESAAIGSCCYCDIGKGVGYGIAICLGELPKEG